MMLERSTNLRQHTNLASSCKHCVVFCFDRGWLEWEWDPELVLATPRTIATVDQLAVVVLSDGGRRFRCAAAEEASAAAVSTAQSAADANPAGRPATGLLSDSAELLRSDRCAFCPGLIHSQHSASCPVQLIQPKRLRYLMSGP